MLVIKFLRSLIENIAYSYCMQEVFIE